MAGVYNTTHRARTWHTPFYTGRRLPPPSPSLPSSSCDPLPITPQVRSAYPSHKHGIARHPFFSAAALSIIFLSLATLVTAENTSPRTRQWVAVVPGERSGVRTLMCDPVLGDFTPDELLRIPECREDAFLAAFRGAQPLLRQEFQSQDQNITFYPLGVGKKFPSVSIEKLCSKVSLIARQLGQKISGLIIVGHGSPKRIWVQGYDMPPLLTSSQDMQVAECQEALREDGTLALAACHAGEKPSFGDEDFLQRMSVAFHRTVVGPQDGILMQEIRMAKTPTGPSVRFIRGGDITRTVHSGEVLPHEPRCYPQKNLTRCPFSCELPELDMIFQQVLGRSINTSHFHQSCPKPPSTCTPQLERLAHSHVDEDFSCATTQASGFSPYTSPIRALWLADVQNTPPPYHTQRWYAPKLNLWLRVGLMDVQASTEFDDSAKKTQVLACDAFWGASEEFARLQTQHKVKLLF